VLTFISDELDVFRMVSRYDDIRACIAPYNSKIQFEYSMGREIQEVSGAAEGMKFTERCDSPPCSGLSDSIGVRPHPIIRTSRLRCSFDRHYGITDASSIRCFDYSFKLHNGALTTPICRQSNTNASTSDKPHSRHIQLSITTYSGHRLPCAP
jgi:hypothetical protein